MATGPKGKEEAYSRVAHWRQGRDLHGFLFATVSCSPSPASPQGSTWLSWLPRHSPVCSVLTMTLCADWKRSLLHWPVKDRWQSQTELNRAGSFEERLPSCCLPCLPVGVSLVSLGTPKPGTISDPRKPVVQGTCTNQIFW